MKAVFDIAITWACFFAGFAIANKTQWRLTHRNRLSKNGFAFIYYAALSGSTVLLFGTVPALLPRDGDDSSYLFPVGFAVIGIILVTIGLLFPKSKKDD